MSGFFGRHKKGPTPLERSSHSSKLKSIKKHMNNNTFDANQQFDDYSNRYQRQPFGIDPVDYNKIFDEITKVLGITCRGTPSVARAWQHGRLWVAAKPRNECWESAGETGWYRWKLPSSDGALRLHDFDAPAVHLSPSGAIFWVQRYNHQPKRVSIRELQERCQKWADKVEVVA